MPIVLAQQNRQGSHTTAGIVIPAAIDSVLIECLIGSLDLIDPNKSFSLYIEVSNDQITWERECGMAWNGDPDNILYNPGKNPSGNTNPILVFPASLYPDKKARAVISIPVQMNLGCEIMTE